METLIEQLGLKITAQHDNAVFMAKNNSGQRFYWVDHPHAKALIAEQGAHIISYTPMGSDDLLWVSKDSLFEPGKPIRGGVPICWPWFGHRGQPSHGFARINNWQLIKTQTDNDQVIINFELNDNMVEQPPYPFNLKLTMTIGQQLSLSLNSKNTGTAAIAITGALHSYFAANRHTAQVEGLNGSYQDSTQGGKLCNQDKFELDETTDRIYPQRAKQLHLIDGKRKILIESQGEDSIVVWNASPKQVSNMTDMHLGAQNEYLCIETAVTQEPIIIEAGCSHLLEQKISKR